MDGIKKKQKAAAGENRWIVIVIVDMDMDE